MTSMPITSPGAHEARGEAHVVGARRGVAGRVIMEQNHARRTGDGRLAEDLARMDGGRVDGADRQQRRADHAAADVEQDQAEVLDRPGAEARQQVRRRLARRAELRPLGRRLQQRPASQLDGRQQPRRLRLADAGHAAQGVARRPGEPVQPADRRQQALASSRAPRLRWPEPEHDARPARCRRARRRPRARASPAADRRPPAPSLPAPFARMPAAAADACHILFARCRASARSLDPWPRCSLGAAVLAACAEPPTREISQAQGALDAARAAGAEAYARTEFQAADAALKKAHDAVAERDYRQALSFALDAREQARTAAREAAAAAAPAPPPTWPQAIQAAARASRRARTRLAGPCGRARRCAPVSAPVARPSSTTPIARSALSGRRRRLRPRGGARSGRIEDAARRESPPSLRRAPAEARGSQSPISGPSSVTAADDHDEADDVEQHAVAHHRA